MGTPASMAAEADRNLVTHLEEICGGMVEDGKADFDLAGIRDPRDLERLLEPDRRDGIALRAEVDALIRSQIPSNCKSTFTIQFFLDVPPASRQ